jgi:hypothetical protein
VSYGCGHGSYLVFSSVGNWPQNTKMAAYKYQQPNFWQIFQKMAEKRPNFFGSALITYK